MITGRLQTRRSVSDEACIRLCIFRLMYFSLESVRLESGSYFATRWSNTKSIQLNAVVVALRCRIRRCLKHTLCLKQFLTEKMQLLTICKRNWIIVLAFLSHCWEACFFILRWLRRGLSGNVKNPALPSFSVYLVDPGCSLPTVQPLLWESGGVIAWDSRINGYDLRYSLAISYQDVPDIFLKVATWSRQSSSLEDLLADRPPSAVGTKDRLGYVRFSPRSVCCNIFLAIRQIRSL